MLFRSLHLVADPEVTAIFCANDELALGLIRAMHEQGRRVPQDVSVVGFDGLANPYRKNSSFAVVISKKVLKSAVRRNRVRRRIYEIIRRELPNLKNSQDIAVIVFSAEVLAMPHAELQTAIKNLFFQAKLYK